MHPSTRHKSSRREPGAVWWSCTSPGGKEAFPERATQTRGTAFRKSTSSLLKTSWMQLQRDTDTTAEDEGKAPWSRGCSASAMLSVSILDMFGAGAPKRAKQEASSPPRDLPVAGKERGHSGGGHSGVPWVLCCSSGSIQEQMSPLPPLPAVRAAWHHVPQQMI